MIGMFQDEMFESASMVSGPKFNVYDNARFMGGNTTAMLEALQAQVKQKEGEVVQLQMEISGLERVKEGLTAELDKLTVEAGKVPFLEDQIRELNKRYTEVEQKYQTMLTVRMTSYSWNWGSLEMSNFFADVRGEGGGDGGTEARRERS